MMAEAKLFDEFDPIFGEATLELDQGMAPAFFNSLANRSFLFYAHTIDSCHLEIVASDFLSHTFERVLTVSEFDDLVAVGCGEAIDKRDETGIGGSWNDFVHYFAASLSEGNVQLILGGVDDFHTESNAKHAKLIAHKSKGLPRVSVSLSRLVNLSAKGVTANISSALFQAYKSKQNDIVKGQEQLSRLKEMLSSERERNKNLQKQLDAFSFSSKRKASKISEKPPNIPEKLENNEIVVSKAEQTSANVSHMEKQSQRNAPHTKGSQRAVPAYRRSKVRGVSLQGNEDDDGS